MSKRRAEGRAESLLSLVAQSAMYLVGRVLPAGIGIVGVSIYTRLVDPGTIGRYAALSAIALLFGVAFNWLRVAVFRALGGLDTLSLTFTRTVALLFLLVAVCVASTEAAALSLFWRGLGPVIVALTVVSSITQAWFDLSCIVLQGQQRALSFTAASIARAVVALSATIMFLRAGFGTAGLMGGFVCGNLTTMWLLGRWLRGVGGDQADFALARSLFAFGWPATASALMSQVSVTCERLLITGFGTSAALGVYAVAADMSRQTVTLLISSVAVAGQSKAMHILDRQGRDAAVRQLRRNALLIAVVGVPTVFGLATLAQPIASVLLGPRFRGDAGFAFGIIGSSAALAAFRSFYLDHAFELARNTKPQAMMSVVVGVATILSNVVLVPMLGARGAAISSLVVTSLAVLLSIGWGRSVFRLPLPFRDWLNVGLAASVMVGVLTVVPKRGGPLWLAVDLAIGASVYAGTLCALIGAGRAAGSLWPRRAGATAVPMANSRG